MLLTLTIWHGTTEQRATARAESSQFHLVRRLELLELAKSNDCLAFSYLHHLSPNAQQIRRIGRGTLGSNKKRGRDGCRVGVLFQSYSSILIIRTQSTLATTSPGTPRMPKSVRMHWVCEASSCNNRRIFLGPGCSHSLHSMTL
jgi:hypothetical protein